MKLTLAIFALVSYYVGVSIAFQHQIPLTSSRTNNNNQSSRRKIVGDNYDTLLMAATMDGTAMTELVANGARRKKTKEVCNILFNYSVTNSITLWERELVDR
jgi:hypothetical protein